MEFKNGVYGPGGLIAEIAELHITSKYNTIGRVEHSGEFTTPSNPLLFHFELPFQIIFTADGTLFTIITGVERV